MLGVNADAYGIGGPHRARRVGERLARVVAASRHYLVVDHRPRQVPYQRRHLLAVPRIKALAPGAQDLTRLVRAGIGRRELKKSHPGWTKNGEHPLRAMEYT